MDNAKKHWKILQKLETDLANRVQSFMVFGESGEGLLVATENGEAFWLGKMTFGVNCSKTATEPTQLDIPGRLVHMAHSNSHILLLNKRGEIYALGKNDRGQLGLGTLNYYNYTLFSILPQLILTPYKFTSVRCGNGHSVALTDDGKVCAWGSNDYGQVGESSSTPSIPFVCQIRELDSHRVVAVECGGWHSLALTDQGEVYGWGANNYGQLGHKIESSPQLTPTQIPTPGPVRSIAAGTNHTLLLTQTGEVYACGWNEEGQLGLPTTTVFSVSLVQVGGLPSISQILSHPLADMSIATTSNNQQCFVWGRLANGMKISTPMELIPVYTNVESLFSISRYCSTSHSVILPAKDLSFDSVPDMTLPSNNRLLDRIGKMFNNPESSPDVRFQLTGDQSILAHQSVLQISSGHFHRLFCSLSSDTQTSQSDSSSISRYTTTNPSELDSNSTTSHCPIQVTIPISGHSYPTFHAYLRFLYLGILDVSPEHLVDLFSLSVAYLELDLQQLCLSRMRSTLTFDTCCLFYQLTLQHSLPELGIFQQELVKFISANFREVIDSEAYKSMDAELCKKLTLSIAKLSL